MDKPRLPDVYADGQWRNVTPVCAVRQRIGVGVDVPGRGTVRLALTLEDARALSELLALYTKSPGGSQWPMSLLSPSDPKSVPSDGVKVCPPAASSMAIAAEGYAPSDSPRYTT